MLGAALLYAVGAVSPGVVISWEAYWLGQAMVTAIQLVTHFSNEFFDFESDRVSEHRTWLTGGSGVLVEGRLEKEISLRAAAVSAVFAAGLVVVVYLLEPAAGLIGTVALLAGWFYSAPPLRLEASGLGEVVATAVVAAGVPVTAALLQASEVPVTLWWAVASMACLQFAMLVAFSLPDVDTDRQAGKRVLAARLGVRSARVVQAGAVAAGLAVLVGGVVTGVLGALLLPLLIPSAVAGAAQLWAAGREADRLLVTSAAATLLLAAGALLALFLSV